MSSKVKRKVQSNKQSILIVEDDSNQLKRYLQIASSAGLYTQGALSKNEALSILERESFQFVLTDIHLNGQDKQDTFEGLSLLSYIQDSMPEVIPLAMTSDPRIETYERVLAVGVAHHFRKPIANSDELLIHLDAAQHLSAMGKAPRQAPGQYPLPSSLRQRCPDGIVMPDKSRHLLRKFAARRKAPIVIYGETGTGKEEAAKLVHQWRCELDGPLPFVAVNCANLTGDTAVSTLFGHCKGAFTGADQTATGCIGAADNGILFLDEIHALTLECQQRLLRTLNDGSYNRLGETKLLRSDFQVIVATTRDLDEEVERGSFLLDLRSRLTGLDLRLEPLRDRFQDLPLLIEIGLARQGVTLPGEELDRLVLRCMEFYWQGNIRQLFQVLQSLVFLGGNEAADIRAEDLPVFKTMLPPKGVENTGSSTSFGRFDDLLREREADLLFTLLEKAREIDPRIISSQRKSAAHLGMSRHGFVSVLRRAAMIREIPARFAHLVANEV